MEQHKKIVIYEIKQSIKEAIELETRELDVYFKVCINLIWNQITFF